MLWNAPFDVNAGGTWANWTASVNGSATLRYDHVPEPSSLLLVGAAIAAMARRIYRSGRTKELPAA